MVLMTNFNAQELEERLAQVLKILMVCLFILRTSFLAANVCFWCQGPCKLETWNIPRDFEFLFDEQSMVAPPGNPKKASPDTKWQENHPKCPHCGKLSRPNVYMFGDQCFVENIYENTNWLNWSHAVKALLKQNKDISLVMLELGVGIRLPKVRVAFERLLLECPPRQAKIIRVNPEFQQTIEKGLNPEDLICLSEGALSALEKINTYIK